MFSSDEDKAFLALASTSSRAYDLPIHLLCHTSTKEEAQLRDVELVIKAFPAGLSKKNYEGLFPLQMAQAKAGLLQGAQIPTTSTSTYTGPIPGAYQNAPLSTGLGTLTSLGSLFSSGVGGTSAVKGISDWLSSLGNSSNPGYVNPNSFATSNPNGAMDAVSRAPVQYVNPADYSAGATLSPEAALQATYDWGGG
jgi:hypothetical protein